MTEGNGFNCMLGAYPIKATVHKNLIIRVESVLYSIPPDYQTRLMLPKLFHKDPNGFYRIAISKGICLYESSLPAKKQFIEQQPKFEEAMRTLGEVLS